MGKFLLVIALFAAVVYAMFWALERRRSRKRQVPGPRPSAPRRTNAPDDDEEFLRELEQRRRRAAHEQQAKKPNAPEDKPADREEKPEEREDKPAGKETPGPDQSRPE